MLIQAAAAPGLVAPVAAVAAVAAVATPVASPVPVAAATSGLDDLAGAFGNVLILYGVPF